jgi:hypothetical protein
MVMTGFDSLDSSARDGRTEASSRLAGFSSRDALDLVMWAHYESSDRPAVPEISGGDENLCCLEVLPSTAGPFFDGWEAILLVRDERESLIYRHEGGALHEGTWQVGTFERIVGQAKTEFERLAKTALPSFHKLQ